MQQQDFDDFTSLMLGVAENYGQTVTAEGIALRFKMLAPYPVEDVRSATLSILSSRKYTSMPTVADFMEHLGGGSLEDKAEVEAGKVLTAIARVGGYASVVFDDPTTQAVIQNAYGGWPKLCEDCGVEESERWFRHNFAKTWAAYKRQGIQAFGALPGRNEIANLAAGHYAHIPKPHLVGDEDTARKVLQMGPREAPRQLEGPVSFKEALRRSFPAEETREFTQ